MPILSLFSTYKYAIIAFAFLAVLLFAGFEKLRADRAVLNLEKCEVVAKALGDQIERQNASVKQFQTFQESKQATAEKALATARRINVTYQTEMARLHGLIGKPTTCDVAVNEVRKGLTSATD